MRADSDKYQALKLNSDAEIMQLRREAEALQRKIKSMEQMQSTPNLSSQKVTAQMQNLSQLTRTISRNTSQQKITPQPTQPPSQNKKQTTASDYEELKNLIAQGYETVNASFERKRQQTTGRMTTDHSKKSLNMDYLPLPKK